jgi:beta-lactamase superfamily II metal-dependent hydrolase
MIKRIFHPIGQGAFYSERHNNFTVVYDCGNSSRRLTSPVVAQAFNKDDVIDILFISHFDWDHISKIKALRNHTNIKKGVMPLLHKEEKILLTNIYEAMGESDISSFISNPSKFFGDAQITIVMPANEKYQNTNISEDIDHYMINKTDSDKIDFVDSATQIPIDFEDWVYIPYNYEYEKRNKALVNELKKAGFDMSKLTEDPTYALDAINNRKEKNKIKEIYENLDGNINQNSMMLYSGPKDYKHVYFLEKCNKSCKYFHPCYSCYNLKNKRVACIYTGDSDLNINKIKSIYLSLWKNVGTIQIPHHGSLTSFDSSVLQDKNYCCPISFGKNNTYGHPSAKVQSEILANNCYQVNVTDDLDSAFIQIIYDNIDLRGPKFKKIGMK